MNFCKSDVALVHELGHELLELLAERPRQVEEHEVREVREHAHLRWQQVDTFGKILQFLAGSFSAVSKRNFTTKYAFDSIFQAEGFAVMRNQMLG